MDNESNNSAGLARAGRYVPGTVVVLILARACITMYLFAPAFLTAILLDGQVVRLLAYDVRMGRRGHIVMDQRVGL